MQFILELQDRSTPVRDERMASVLSEGFCLSALSLIIC